MQVQLQGFHKFIEISGPRMRSAAEQGRGFNAMPTPEEAAQQLFEEMAEIGEQHCIRHPICHSMLLGCLVEMCPRAPDA
jgi:hypothetical protein